MKIPYTFVIQHGEIKLLLTWELPLTNFHDIEKHCASY